MPTWVEVASVIGGAIGAVGGTVGAVGGWMGYQAKRRSNEIADSALRLDHQRRHDELGPPKPPGIEVDRREIENRGGASIFGIFGSVAVPRDYRVRVDAINTERVTWPVELPALLRKGSSYRFEIERWGPDRHDMMAKELWFRFWPPATVDEAQLWTCPCGRPLTGGGDRDPGHWEWRVPVEYRYTPPQIF